MSASTDLVLNIIGKNDSAVKALNATGDQAEKTSSKVGASFKKLAGVAAGLVAVGGLKDFLSGSMDEARESQKVNAQTAAVLKSTGEAAHVTAGHMGDLATKISNYAGIDDEAVQSGGNLLLTFTNIRNEVGKGNDVFDQALGITTDLSVALGTDMKSSATLVGKALNDPIRGLTALQRVGVTFTAQQRDQIKAMQDAGDTMGAQKVILAELKKEFGGSAAAQATAADKLAVSWGNFKESVGTALIPLVDKLATILNDDVMPAVSALVPLVTGLATKLAAMLGPALRAVSGFLKDNATAVLYSTVVVGGMWAAWKGYTIARTAMVALSGGLTTLRLKAMYAADGLKAVATGQKAATWKQSAVGVGLFAVGVYAAGKAIGNWVDNSTLASHALKDLTGTQREWTAALEQSNGAMDENVRHAVAQKLQQGGLADAAAKAGISLGDLTDAVTGNDAALDGMIKRWEASGKPADSTIFALSMLHNKFTQSADDAQNLSAATKDTSGALKDNADATNSAADSQGKLADQTADTTDAVKAQDDEAQALSDTLDKLSGKNISAARASLDFKDKLASLGKQVKDNSQSYKDNGRSLSSNTEEGRKNLNWMLDAITSANDHANAVFKQTGSLDKATDALHKDESALRKAATAAGLNKDQVDALIRKYAAVPSKVNTSVNANTGVAKNKLQDLQDLLNKIANGKYTAHVDATGSVRVSGAGSGGSQYSGHYAQGTGHAARGLAVVGEYGRELLQMQGGEKIIPHTQAESILAGHGTGGTTVVVNVAGSLISAERDLVHVLERYAGAGGTIKIAKAVN